MSIFPSKNLLYFTPDLTPAGWGRGKKQLKIL